MPDPDPAACHAAGNLELLGAGTIPADYWDWRYGASFDWNRGEQQEEEGNAADAPLPPATVVGGDSAGQETKDAGFYGLELRLDWPRPLQPAGDMAAAFSNYVRGFQGLLDYVW